VSTAFAPLAQIVGEGIGYMSLPIVVVPHPVGKRDSALIVQAGRNLVEECVRLLTTEVGALTREFDGKQYPLPRGVMPR